MTQGYCNRHKVSIVGGDCRRCDDERDSEYLAEQADMMTDSVLIHLQAAWGRDMTPRQLARHIAANLVQAGWRV